MKIKKLRLEVKNLKKQKEFYINVLGFKLFAENKNEFAIQVGSSELTFIKSDKDIKYHYCFLIPSNKLKEAVNWLKERLTIITIDTKKETQYFESWNAESVYFYDGAGNIAEFIVRYDLDNQNDGPFNISQIVSVNEIGMPSNNNVTKLHKHIEKTTGSKLWKGDLERFATNGTQNGLFLIVNNAIKKQWFPTTVFPESAPFKAVIEVNKQNFEVNFVNETLKILKL